MGDLFEYLKWRGDIRFEDSLFTEVDGLILSAFSYINPPPELQKKKKYTIADLNEAMNRLPLVEQKKSIRNDNDLKLLKVLAGSIRFGQIRILAFTERIDSENESQFAAYSLQLCKNKTAVVYRGTDHTITGWKEDFNMSFLEKIPSQVQALEWLQETAAHKGSLYLCGHSKGGNLAVYAATTCSRDIASRIADVYNYDGPGFSTAFVKQPSYQDMLPRLHTLVPESSIVGILFVHEEPYEFVQSKNMGIAQHEPYSWKVLGGSVIRSNASTNPDMNFALQNWLGSMTNTQRKEVVERLFGLLQESDASNLEDIAKLKTVLAAGRQYNTYSEQEKALLADAIKAFRITVTNSFKKKK